jgi:hypothetical protein
MDALCVPTNRTRTTKPASSCLNQNPSTAYKDGAVYLSGSARTQAAVDQALTIARETDGVRSVHNDLTVKKDD